MAEVASPHAVASSKGPSVDISHWPLVIIAFPRDPLTDAHIESLIATLTGILRRREKHLVILDSLDVESVIDARQRRRFTAFVQDAEMRELSRFKLADVILVRSALLRGAMTAVFWLAPPVSPTKPFADIDEALPFIKERFRAEGLTFTPALEARLLRMRRR